MHSFVRMALTIKAKDQLRQFANLIILPVCVFYDYSPRFNGESVGDVSRATQPMLSASSWAYLMWVPVLAGHFAYALFQGLPHQQRRPLHRNIGWLTVINAALGAYWTFAFSHHAYASAALIMVAMLMNLALMESRIGEDAEIGKARWFVRSPFALNFGWVSIVTILNLTQTLSAFGYTGAPLSPVIWANVLVLGALALGGFMAIVRKKATFAIAIAWGLVGIAAFEWGHVTSVTVTAGAGAVALFGIAVVELISQRSNIFARSESETSARPSRKHTLRSA